MILILLFLGLSWGLSLKLRLFILLFFDILEFLSFFDNFENDILVIFLASTSLIVCPIVANSVMLIGTSTSFGCKSSTTVGKTSFGRERVDFLVKLMLIFLFISTPLQRLQRLSPSPHSLCTLLVTGLHHYIQSLSRRSLLQGDSFFSHVTFLTCPFICF